MAVPWISSRRSNDRILVPIENGVADFTRGLVVNATAGCILDAYEETEDWDVAAEALERYAGIPRSQATLDVKSLRADLSRRGFLGGDGAKNGRSMTGEDSPLRGQPPLSGEDLEVLARAALSEKLSFFFRARGHSMRPWVPDGSLLEVECVSFEDVSVGDVVLYSAGEHRLVAHRVIAFDTDTLVTRGDSSPRVDRVDRGVYVGRVAALIRRGVDGKERRIDLLGSWRRFLGRGSSLVYWRLTRVGFWIAIPVRRSFRGRSLLRGAVWFVLRTLSSALLRIERWAQWLRRPLDVCRSGMLSTREKDEQRRRLYGTLAVQEFTALDENVRAGLTLIEEVALVRLNREPARALVLGCGPGREAFVLAERGFDVVGLDWQETMVERARSEAERRGLSIEFLTGEADDFRLNRTFETIIVFSGLYNMLLPRERRVRLLECAASHLVSDGEVVLTFLSAYVESSRSDDAPRPSFLRALNSEHEPGDFYLINEVVHVFPHVRDLLSEVHEAGFKADVVFRDQRAYDKVHNQVRGYVILSLDR